MDPNILQIVQKLLCGAISISILLASVPAIRSTLGIFGIGIIASSFSLFFVQSDDTVSYISAIRTGIVLSIPLLISNELISLLAKSFEILRGSQLAEQLFVQERGGPIESGLVLFLGSMFLSAGGGEMLLTQVLLLNSANSKEVAVDGAEALAKVYRTALSYFFPLAGLGVVLELLSGMFQRVSRKSYLGTEFSYLRFPFAILLLLELLEEV